jgi:1-acyl-sn-glycerol-3-phosphate acyltransferase
MTRPAEPSGRTSRPAWVDEQIGIVSRTGWAAWPTLLRYGAPLLSLFGRIRVTREFDPRLLDGPLLLAANHIGNFDTFLVAVACRRIGITPQFLVTRGIMSAPVIGPFLNRAGHIRVDRGSPDAAFALPVTEAALRHGGHVMVYPEGRIGLDPELWPERGRTGLARLALRTGVPVLPVSQWGAHEVTAYDDWAAMLRTTTRSIWRQPRLAVHFGVPVPLDDLEPDRLGDANRAATRIIAAVTEGLQPLRAHEPGLPRFVDPTRPVVADGTAAFPGGRIPPGLLPS